VSTPMSSLKELAWLMDIYDLISTLEFPVFLSRIFLTANSADQRTTFILDVKYKKSIFQLKTVCQVQTIKTSTSKVSGCKKIKLRLGQYSSTLYD
jgi:hypothetical protein